MKGGLSANDGAAAGRVVDGVTPAPVDNDLWHGDVVQRCRKRRVGGVQYLGEWVVCRWPLVAKVFTLIFTRARKIIPFFGECSGLSVPSSGGSMIVRRYTRRWCAILHSPKGYRLWCISYYGIKINKI